MKKIIAAALTVSLLFGCSEKAANLKFEPEKVSGSLSVYYLEDDNYYSDALEHFRLIYPDVTVNETLYKDNEELTAKLKTDTGTGGGPDVFLFYPDTDIDAMRLMESGMLLDLSGFIASDESYNPDNYNQKMMEGGIVDGEQCIIPLTYNLPFFVTTEEKLLESSLQLESDYTYGDLLSVLTSDIENRSSDSSKLSIRPLVRDDGIYDIIFDILDASGVSYSTDVDNAEFRRTMDFFKALYGENEKLMEFSEKYTYTDFIKLNQNVNFYFNTFNFPYNAYFFDSLLRQATDGEKSRLLPVPTYNNPEEYIAVAYRYAAVNSNSKNKNAAYAFIRNLMDTEQPVDAVWEYDRADIPVSKEQMNRFYMDYKYAFQSRYDIGEGVRFECENMTPEMQAIIDGILDKTNVYVIPNNPVKKIIMESMTEYINGNREYDVCLEQLKQKLELYLNE